MKTILVIDDELASLRLTLQILEYEGYRVSTAESGHDGNEMARRILPQLVITDVNLPDKSGFEVVETLRADPETRGTAVIFISGNSDPEYMRRAQSLGSDHYLVKPFSIGRLLDAIRSCLPEANVQVQ